MRYFVKYSISGFKCRKVSKKGGKIFFWGELGFNPWGRLSDSPHLGIMHPYGIMYLSGCILSERQRRSYIDVYLLLSCTYVGRYIIGTSARWLAGWGQKYSLPMSH